MTIFEKLLVLSGDFFKAYGGSFLLMVVAGFLIAAVTELGIKKAFNWLEEKLGDKPYLSIARIAVIVLFTMFATAYSVVLMFKGELPLPGNKALAPFWFAIIYFIQWVFSMKGIKGILRIKDRPKKEKPAKEPKEKKVSPVEGYIKIAKNCYKDPATDKFYNKKGEQL